MKERRPREEIQANGVHDRRAGCTLTRMDSSHLLVFGITYLIALALPGPGVAALLGQVLVGGVRGAPAYIAGTVLGTPIGGNFDALVLRTQFAF